MLSGHTIKIKTTHRLAIHWAGHLATYRPSIADDPERRSCLIIINFTSFFKLKTIYTIPNRSSL